MIVQALDEELAIESVHEPEPLKLPPFPPSLQETLPVGVVGLLPVSVTVTVKVIMLPAATDDGLGVTLVLVGSVDPEDACRIASAIKIQSACPLLSWKLEVTEL